MTLRIRDGININDEHQWTQISIYFLGFHILEKIDNLLMSAPIGSREDVPSGSESLLLGQGGKFVLHISEKLVSSLSLPLNSLDALNIFPFESIIGNDNIVQLGCSHILQISLHSPARLKLYD